MTDKITDQDKAERLVWELEQICSRLEECKYGGIYHHREAIKECVKRLIELT